MGIHVEPYRPPHIEAVRAFNARVTAQGAAPGFLLAETPLTPRPGSPILRRAFLAIEDGEVRGGFELHRQTFCVGDRVCPVSHYRAPLSEGIVDRRYAYLGMLMVKEALRETPCLFGIGMGGVEQPLPRLLRALGFALHTVPFLFRVCRPARVLGGLPVLRATPRRALLASLLAASGAGWLAFRSLARAADLWARRGPRVTVNPVGSWDTWADELWHSARGRCSLVAVRDAAALSAIYPIADRRNICLCLSHGGRPVGWAVLYDTPMRGSRHFGDLRVGAVLDIWARPSYGQAVAHATTRELERRGVDLIVLNHAHPEWVAAFRRTGFLAGPSNYGLALSPVLAAAVRAEPEGEARMHITRGDGDGRVHL